MKNPIRDCGICGQAYWSVPVADDAPAVCPECAEIAAPGSGAAEAPAEPPRFVALSALPPEKRLPPRRTLPEPVVPKPEAETAARPDPVMAGSTLPLPRPAALQHSRVIAPSLPPPVPVAPPVRPVPAVREPVPVPSIPAALQQIGFNCPSCFTVLVIKDPSSYDGRAAPCPYCAVTILPPRVAPPTPFTLVAAAPLPPQGQGNPGRLKWTSLAQEAEVA